ncbi:MAG TPA: DNA polymerase III subunit delta' [Pyrinomonadaceae bacterium]|nr:DNA polymerase III subunit delta' [Pyrinomonadaceae bacterium]
MFDQLIGNDRVKKLLRRMLANQRLPGAMLFSGEDGVGKKLFALEIARALNCRTPQGIEGCGHCPPCLRIAKFNYPTSEESDDWKGIIWTDHPDVGIVVAPKRVLLVEQMRAIEREANYRPFEGKARVFIVEDADKLNDNSANALLKILEEPPPTSHIILLTSRPAWLLPTIRSRCQIIRFSPVAAAEIERYLTQEKIAGGEEARLRARKARGSLSRALDEDLDGFIDQRNAMLEVLEALALSDDRLQLLRSAEQLNEAQYKDEYEMRLDVLETLIRDVWLLSLGADAEIIVNDDVLPQLKRMAESLDNKRPAIWIGQIEEMREQLIVNINRKPATDALFLTMAAASATELPPKRRYIIK